MSEVTKAAGILFLAPGDRALLLKRSFDANDHGGEWDLPGGGLKNGEDEETGAVREAKEETGQNPKGDRAVHLHNVAGGVDFTTFRQRVSKEFVPVLDDEHVAWAWAPVEHPPEPMHPGAMMALRRLKMTETDVVDAIVAGELSSPQRFENSVYYAMRISGTGVAYRHKLKEFVWRDPDMYLNPEMIKRCYGMPVIVEHPKPGILDSDEYEKRNVGTIVRPYQRGYELWGVARIFDDKMIKILETEALSTSPAVVFGDPEENEEVELEDGSTLLIEGRPTLIDHLAICEEGVWDKMTTPRGIETDLTRDEGTLSLEGDDVSKTEAIVPQPTVYSAKLDQVVAGASSLANQFRMDSAILMARSLSRQVSNLLDRRD